MVTIQEMLQAGGHFGHRKSKWNPRMAEFIYMERNGIHIIDVRKTLEKLEEAKNVIRKVAASGKELLLVGTKHQAREVVGRYAEKVGIPYVNYRWMGGMLTNFETIRRSIKKLEDMNVLLQDESAEQKYTKKEMLIFKRKRDKLKRDLSGIVKLDKMPGVVFVVDTKIESIAVLEALKLKIPVAAIVDTISDPNKIDYPIPFNDDGVRSIELIVKELTDAYEAGVEEYREKRISEGGKTEKKKSFGDETRRVAGRKVRVKRLATGKKEEEEKKDSEKETSSVKEKPVSSDEKNSE
ncbi:MAG: 30S ribosomal protein S2 [bacterium]